MMWVEICEAVECSHTGRWRIHFRVCSTYTDHSVVFCGKHARPLRETKETDAWIVFSVAKLVYVG